MSQIDIERYTKACEYPATLDVAAVENAISEYLAALNLNRKIVRLQAGWTLDDHPSLQLYVNGVLDEFEKRNPSAMDAMDARAARAAMAAMAAMDAMDARDALSSVHRFTAWCIQAHPWMWWRFELSWVVTTYFGAVQKSKPDVIAWCKPLLDAFINGAWLLHWTEDTLFWVAKPTVHVDRSNGMRRLHNDQYAAVESDIENLYFIKGVLVPAFVVVKPEWITTKHINDETNAEVKRIMLERYGVDRYLQDVNAKPISRDDFGELYEIDGGEIPIKIVKLVNSTPEPDGTNKLYFLKGRHDSRTAHECVASTFGLKAETYRPVIET